ncbi:helix-turn-helix domain-containing protein [Hungatella hathewayi]|uniref:helix-turn-helix transcriptional regulator n=1 Tax=Hungatella hathewayi TaxID=154046 RepID=UPI0021A510B0|nr:helix-turn-helix transcriptional regulator [Hungatella hathewayi]UWO83160.1 helix-turn-helix domain-containing protein [Hungatella hathewayi]
MSDIIKLPLKSLRAKVNLTQQQVAAQVGVDRLTYGKWENYQTFPDALQLIKLSEIFECSMDTFYFPLDAS